MFYAVVGPSPDGVPGADTPGSRTAKIKESDTVKVGSWLVLEKLKVWRNHLRKNFTLVTTNLEKAFDAVPKVEMLGTTFEDVEEVDEELQTLVAKLLTALTAIQVKVEDGF